MQKSFNYTMIVNCPIYHLVAVSITVLPWQQNSKMPIGTRGQ